VNESERRRHPRYSCEAQVEIIWGEVTLDAMLRDISASGMYLDTHEPLWARAEFSAPIFYPRRSANALFAASTRARAWSSNSPKWGDETPMNLNHLIWKLAHP